MVLAVICWSPEAVLPDRALCLPTLSHLLIVNTTSLSLSFCLSLSPGFDIKDPRQAPVQHHR